MSVSVSFLYLTLFRHTLYLSFSITLCNCMFDLQTQDYVPVATWYVCVPVLTCISESMCSVCMRGNIFWQVLTTPGAPAM